MTYFKAVDASGANPIVLCGGDFLFALNDYKSNSYKREQMKQKAELIIDCYNRFGYDAAAVGECDLALGLQTLQELAKSMHFPLLCANLVKEDDGSLLFAPSKVIEKNGLRVGIVAALMDSLSPTYLGKVAPGVKVTPPVAAIRAEVEKLAGKADVIFVLAHVNMNTVSEIADSVPNVDFILEPNSFFGNHGTWVNDGDHFRERNGRVLLRSDGEGSHVGRLDITWHGGGARWVSGESAAKDAGGKVNIYEGRDISLGPQFGSDATVQEMVSAYRRTTRHVSLEDPPDGFVPSKRYLTAPACSQCHEKQAHWWQNTDHAHAYATLEKTGDEFRYDCLPCHVTGYGETFLDAHAAGKFKNVQCEACHGTNPDHPADPEKHPWPRVNDKACWGCHDPRQTRAPFHPETAIPKVACPPLEK